MNKLVYLGLSKLELSKIVMQKSWYDRVKPKYQESNLCYGDIHGFTVYIKAEDILNGIAPDVKQKFDTWNYKLKIPLLKGKKVLCLIMEKLKINMKKLFGLKAKFHNYLRHDGGADKNSKGWKKVCYKNILKFEDYNISLKAT